MFDEIEAELLPLLGWMKNLKSLVILRNGFKTYSSPTRGIVFVRRLLDWLLPQLQYLERLWVTEDYEDYDLSSPFLKSIFYEQYVFYLPNMADDVLKGERYVNLEHIGGGNINLNHLVGLYPDLKYVAGYCEGDLKVYD